MLAQPLSKSDADPVIDVDIPEVNTNFMDNLFQDPAFLDRFDASYQQTAPAGIEAEKTNRSTETEGNANLLEIDFQTNKKD
jgi:hypothetical protein